MEKNETRIFKRSYAVDCRAALVILLFIFLYSPLFPTFGTVKGNVKKNKGNLPLANVKVTIVFIENPRLRYEFHTDKKGNFYKSWLQPGMYRIAFDKRGYVPAQSTVRLLKAREREFNIRLEALPIKTSDLSFELLTAAKRFMAVGNHDAAIDKISLAVEKEPGSFILYYNRAIGYEKKGDKENARSDYKKSLELKPDFLLSITALGKMYAEQGDYVGAASYYRKAFDLGITDSTVLYNYGASLVNQENIDEAKTVFDKVILLDPYYADAYYQVGIIYLGLNDNAKAKEYLEKFVEMAPGNSNAPTAKQILKALE